MLQLIYASGLSSVAACSPQVLPHCHKNRASLCVVMCTAFVSCVRYNQTTMQFHYISFSCGELQNVISIFTLTQCITFQVQAHPGGRFVKLLRATDQYSQHEMCVHKGVS